MKTRWWNLAPIAMLLLPGLLLLPLGSGSPVYGTVTQCSTTAVCKFVFNSSAGTGWASTTPTNLSFQLPGEPQPSFNLSYVSYIQRLTGYYTYWTVGNFVGTDVNTGRVVYGTTNTNFTITAHCQRGCTYNHTTDNGTIVFRFTHAEQTSLSVSCSPSSVRVVGKTACTVTVTNLWNGSNPPSGKVHLSSGSAGTFANKGTCTLLAGTCSLTWRAHDETLGAVTITAAYAGNGAFYKSGGTTVVYVA